MQLDSHGYIYQCDICAAVADYNCAQGRGYIWACSCSGCLKAQADCEIVNEIWSKYLVNSLGHNLHYSRALPMEFPRDLCRDCQVKMTPIVQRFCEIAMIRIFNGRLERAINDRRKENRATGDNRTVEDDACQRCEGGNAGAT